MEPITIAASVVTLLMPLVKNSAEAFAGEAGKAVYKQAKDLFAILKAKLSKDSDAKLTLKRFKKKPDDYKRNFLDLLNEKISDDKNFAKELVDILNDIKKSGPEVKVVFELGKVETLNAGEIEEMYEGRYEALIKVRKAKVITGPIIGRIGRRNESGEQQ